MPSPARLPWPWPRLVRLPRPPHGRTRPLHSPSPAPAPSRRWLAATRSIVSRRPGLDLAPSPIPARSSPVMSVRAAISVLVILAFFAFAGYGRVFAHDRPHGPLHKTRSAVVARNGMAATSQPLATATAIRVLQ